MTTLLNPKPDMKMNGIIAAIKLILKLGHCNATTKCLYLSISNVASTGKQFSSHSLERQSKLLCPPANPSLSASITGRRAQS